MYNYTGRYCFHRCLPVHKNWGEGYLPFGQWRIPTFWLTRGYLTSGQWWEVPTFWLMGGGTYLLANGGGGSTYLLTDGGATYLPANRGIPNLGKRHTTYHVASIHCGGGTLARVGTPEVRVGRTLPPPPQRVPATSPVVCLLQLRRRTFLLILLSRILRQKICWLAGVGCCKLDPVYCYKIYSWPVRFL